MAGIHLPDIGKLGIHIATGIRDKKKVTPSNMAENARFQALATRLDTEKHERSRVLKKEERRMKRKKHRIDKRRQDIQKNKKQEVNSNVDRNDRKKGFLPSISHAKTASVNDCKDDLLSEDRKDINQYSGSPHSAIFPIQDEISRLLDSANSRNRASEKRKIILPSIETGSGEGNVKYRKTIPLKKRSKKHRNITNRNNNILEGNFAESNVLRNSQVFLSSPEETKTLPTSNNSTGEELEVDTKVSSQARTKEQQIEDETHEQIINGTDFSIEELEPSANPFNYLLLEEQRRKAIHQNLEDAFRAIKTCRYIRTPSRREKETDDE